jgi:hypothetical protein
MKPIEIKTDKFRFRLEDWGYFRLDILNPTCPEESGFTDHIKTQQDRIELARFLGEVSRKLATPKQSQPLMHNPKFDFRLLESK